MSVDNDFYTRAAPSWWDESGPLYALHPSVNTARLEYVLATLERQLTVGSQRVLDLGCGGGFVSEALAVRGHEVCGVDPSQASIEVARAHALESKLSIDYRLGYGEDLPLPAVSVDAVCCLDVLEHVGDFGAVLKEVARVLRPGGVFIFDTINRTLKSRFVIAFLLQDFWLTRLVPKRLHDPRLFITPSELRLGMTRHGMETLELVGMAPSAGLWTLARDMSLCKLGKITPAEAFRRSKVSLSADLSVSYLGFAKKNRASALSADLF